MTKKVISPIVLRTITGSCHSNANFNSLDWSSGSNLVAYGSNLLVVIVDPTTLQTVQILDKHRSPVTRVCWTRAPTSKHPADRLTLASADSTGHIIVWNVKAGEVKAVLTDGNKPIQEMSWLDGRIENTGHLLAALHPPFSFILWDTSTGGKVWKKTYQEALQGFDFDPFDLQRVAFKCMESVFFIDDFHPSKVPTSQGRKFYVRSYGKSSPSRNFSPNNSVPSTPMSEDRSKNTRTKIKRIMKDIVSGDMLTGTGDALTMSECIQVTFHKSVRNHLLLVYSKEVVILDLDIGQTVGAIAMDNSGPSILKVLSATQRDMIFILTEFGAIMAKKRKGIYELMPDFGKSNKRTSTSTLSTSYSSIPTTPGSITGGDFGSVESLHLDSTLEIVYEQKACSESIRLNKNAKILGMTFDPMTEKGFVTLTSDGRLIFTDLTLHGNKSYSDISLELKDIIPSNVSRLDSFPIRFKTRGILSGLASPPFVVRMCPPLTMKNMNDYIPHLAIGSSNGDVQIVNVSTGKLEKEFAVHTFPVRGIEWAGMNTVLSHAHQNLSSLHSSSSFLVRNELICTDIRDGSCTSLRSQRSEEPPIDMLRVSHLKQYFIVAFIGAPFELWDLKNLTLLRTMPKKFPPITALDWSPLHNLKSLKKKMNTEVTEDAKKQAGEEVSESPASKDVNLVAKEHFVFTDPEGQLYHFSVEGNVIRDGTKVPAESSLGTINCIAWKSDHIVRGDSEGNLNVWDVRTRTSRNIATHKGPIKKIRFAPGRGNFKLLVLNPDFVSIWDVKECEMINELRTPKDMTKIIDIDWAASDRAILVTIDGSLRIMGLALAGSTSSMQEYSLDSSVACLPMLANKTRSNLEIFLHHQPWKDQYSLHFTEDDGFLTADLEFVQSLVGHMPTDAKRILEHSETSTLRRCLIASVLCGLSWESEFWKVANYSINSEEPLDLRHEFLCDKECFFQYQERRLAMHETRSINRKSVVDKLICMGKNDDAIRILLETEPDNPDYYQDCLRACLIASSMSDSKKSDEGSHSTTKLVATNLIAEGKIWEGVQLLCQIGKIYEACCYLQSCGKYHDSMWLAKCRRDGHEEYNKVARKYCENLYQHDLKKNAILMFLSMKDYVSVLDSLISSKMIGLAGLFLQVCQERKILPETSHVMVISEEINLAYARHLFDCGNRNGAFYYCDKADEKGEILRRELEVLSSVPGVPVAKTSQVEPIAKS